MVFDVSNNTPPNLIGFSLAFLSMLMFGSSVLSIRYSNNYNLLPFSSFIIRMLCLGFLSFIILIYSYFTFQINTVLPLNDTYPIWIYSFLVGLFQAIGVFCVNQALLYSNTALCIAIFGSNSIVVFILGVLFQNYIPSLIKIIGMSITIISCFILTIL